MADIPFIPIDDAARDGGGYLVRTADDRMHAAAFVAGRWCYSGDPKCPVPGEVVSYVRRPPCAS